MKVACLASLVFLLCLTSSAQTNSYTATPIVNNAQDPYLINPWGMSRPFKFRFAGKRVVGFGQR
jgi:hypothetical protein